MSSHSRAFRATHAPGGPLDPVLPDLHGAIDSPDADARQIAEALSLPVASVRGSLSSYHDTHKARDAIRVCAGTSCMLAGGRGISLAVDARRPCEGVYCLGYCDRSPAAMTPSGAVIAPVGADDIDLLVHDGHAPHPAPPSVRCEARHAIVTERLHAQPTARVPHHGYAGLRAAIAMKPGDVVDAILNAGLRGRGGAAYPTGQKWKLASGAPGSPKYVVANGDEGDPGSFIDRELMERDPHGILEGMAVCAHAIGASEGVVFIRSEYPRSVGVMNNAIEDATHAGFLGENALGNGRHFRVRVVRGMGSYVCGEETALLNAIEGQRGEVRPRPPYPVEQGLFGLPTVVDNVETLVNAPWILLHGIDAFRAMGTPESQGTKALCFNSGFARPGVVEVEFGVPLREAIHRSGGGGAGGRELEAVLLGGPMGSIVTPDQWDVPICFREMARRGINLGHAGIVAIPKGADWTAILRHMLAFMRDESCGKCVPCRMGTIRTYEMAKAGLKASNLDDFRAILRVMQEASLCAFGRETPAPILTILSKFGQRIHPEARS